jgi:hypothetical protein
MQVDSQTQSLDEAGTQDRVGHRFARYPTQASLVERPAASRQASMPTSKIAFC